MQANRIDVESLIGKSFSCECGRTHIIPTKYLIYSDDVISTMPEILERHCSDKSVAIISDSRTHKVAAEDIANSFAKANWSLTDIIVPDTSDGTPPHCDDETYERISAEISDKPEMILAVGAGTINDLAKWLAFDMNIPYAVFATAASMTGYTSPIVAPTIKGVKQVVCAQPAIGVFAAGRIIENAPFKLTTAGLGDALAKPMSSADWIMNNMLFDEHYCPLCTQISSATELTYLDNPSAIRSRQPNVIEALFRGLVYCGFAMTIAGTNVTPSGGEHIFSHTLDMLASIDGGANDYHGRQVGLGVILSAALYSELMQIENPTLRDLPETIDKSFWGGLADGIANDYAAKRPLTKTMQEKFSDKRLWRKYIDRIKGIVKTPNRIKECLKQAGGASGFSDIQCERDRVKSVILHMHEMGTRCTVVELSWAMGILPDRTDDLIDEWLS